MSGALAKVVTDRCPRPSRRVEAIAFTRRGCELALRLAAGLKSRADSEASVSVSGPARLADELGIGAYESLDAWVANAFAASDALLFVGACGIAVRAIAPYVRDKFSDPAVVSVDEYGRVAVPLLSGHVGGANDLARAVAGITDGIAAVSTATDLNGCFAIDEFARDNGLVIAERALAKEISAALLAGCPVSFGDGLGAVATGDLAGRPAGHALGKAIPTALLEGRAVSFGDGLGAVVTDDLSRQPFERTLHLIPRRAVVGVGCRRGTDPAVLEAAVGRALAKASVAHASVRSLATIDVKADELAVLSLAARNGWRLCAYTADELAQVEGEFSSSDFVRDAVGVDNVCERAACASGARLVLGKQAGEGVTVAIAREGGRPR